MKNCTKYIPLVVTLVMLLGANARAQTPAPDSLAKPSEPAVSQTNPLSIYGFVDAYYSFDFGQPDSHERPAFIYNYKRTNEFNVNLALLKLTYVSEKVRGNLGLMAGTYAEYNLAA